MSVYLNDDPPDRGGNAFGRSHMTSRSPPSVTSKRLFCEISPSSVSPDMSKRVQRSESHEDHESSLDTSNANYCDLVSEASTYLSKINDLVNDQGSRINIANKSAIMDMTQRITAIVSLLAIKSSCNETKLVNTQRELDLLKTNPASESRVKQTESYADKLKLRLPQAVPPVQSRAPLPCVVAYPTEERSADYVTSSATKQALMTAIKPSDDGFQIVGVKKVKKSGVILRVANESQIKKLKSVEAIKSAGLRLEKPKGRQPRILVKDVPASMEDKTFLTALYRQNIKDELKVTEDDFIKNTRVIRRRMVNHGRKWIGIEIDSAIRQHLVATKEKLFIDWAPCRFVDDLELVRCNQCQEYGHVRKYCTHKTPTCANCAGAHETTDCLEKDKPEFKPVCVACKRYKKPCDHRTGSQDCPTYKIKLEQLVLSTNY
ncbi:uncharacterized protein LOC113495114 [Trichoplusia ni]|uniref:Uncharacterized protein LOC113495114 n=1 Tax=Trichoplusia ni TaxID=7111 RepID=A0A7E5VMI0_TRINI|nr:uncharacterized protein LOC113495114 [Trichoplusia ni]